MIQVVDVDGSSIDLTVPDTGEFPTGGAAPRSRPFEPGAGGRRDGGGAARPRYQQQPYRPSEGRAFEDRGYGRPPMGDEGRRAAGPGYGPVPPAAHPYRPQPPVVDSSTADSPTIESPTPGAYRTPPYQAEEYRQEEQVGSGESAGVGGGDGGHDVPGSRKARRGGGDGSRSGASHRKKPKRKKHPIRRSILALVLAFLLLVGWSLGNALLAPGTDSISARLAEWARNHGMSSVVTALENWQYNHNPPKVGGTPPPQPTLPAAQISAAAPAGAVQKVTPPPPITPFVTPSQPGEGDWKPLEVVNGQPVVQAAYLRSDPVHTSYLSSVVWVDQKYNRFELHPGSQEPGGGAWSQSNYLAPNQRNGLLLTYNGGFKLADAKGGYYENGHTAGTLVQGAASEIFYTNGSMTVGAWGRDATMGPNIAGVRQNLILLVDNGTINPQVDSNSEAVWGVTINNADFVWRSGVGVTKTGDVVYAAGPDLSVRTLAELLQRAGAVRAMELDINVSWVSCMYYTPSSDPATVATPTKLVDFQDPADRYYQVSSRDFVAVYAR